MTKYYVSYSDSDGFDAETIIEGNNITIEQAQELIDEQANINGIYSTATIEEFTPITNPIQEIICEVNYFFKNKM
jgi:hypothetical protein